MELKQQNRRLQLTTALGEDVLLLTRFSGSEEMSRLFRYQLELISDDPGIQPGDIVGTEIGWSIERSDHSRRHWHGYVSSLARGDVDKQGRRNYRVEVVPWLWFLTQTSDCKVFQEKNIPNIIKEVLGDFPLAKYKTDFQLDHNDWEYCVQYRETDFNFLSRLMEQEGIFYYFQHSDGAHQLVITDHKNGYYTLPESKVDFPRDYGSRAVEDYITSWERRFQYVSGRYAERDYNFKTPSADLTATSKTVVKLPDIGNYEFFDYPGEYPDKGVGDKQTKLRIEEEETAHDVVNATSFCTTFQTGGKFTVGDHNDRSEKGAEVVITTIHHSGSEPMGYETGGSDAGSPYQNSFTSIPSNRAFRAARTTSKPIISGIQTAVITGPAGEEIYPDEHGRVKCQFHWDRYGKKDDKSSCWIRVSQIHAGSGFGAIDIPRVGEEVIVSFLEGDPDRPIITGRVYHAENMPPFGLPDGKKISGIKTKTYQGDGYNEYVMDDTPGEELIREHAQFDKDSTIENDLREHVLKKRTRDVGEDETISIGMNQKISIGADMKLDANGGIEITAVKKITLTVGSSKIEISPSGVKIDAPMVESFATGPHGIRGSVVTIN